MSWCPSDTGPPSGDPPPTQGQTIPDTVTETICNRVMHPIAIMGAILTVLRNQFRQANTLHNNVLRKTVYTDGDDSKIIIDSIYKWKIEGVGTRPALLVKSHGMRFQATSIGDKLGLDKRGHMNYTFRVFGTHSVMAMAIGGEAALWLGQEATMAIADFQPIIRWKLKCSEFRVNNMEGPFGVKESRESFVCPINISWYFDYVWKLHQESPILKEVVLNPTNLLNY